MIKFAKVMIEVDDDDPTLCGGDCDFNEGDECGVYGESLVDGIRCDICMREEVE